MVSEICRAAAVRQKQTFETPIVSFAHRGVHAHVGGDACEYDIPNLRAAEYQLEIGCVEATLARFVNDCLPR